MKIALILLTLLGVGAFFGFVTTRPQNLDNVCKIFKEKPEWYGQAKAAAKRWNSPISVIMAIMHQESGFVHDAKPPRRKIFWVIPGPRSSNAYGYAQALDSTWAWYMKDTGHWGANRRDFGDAADFVGWYNHKSHRLAKISKSDAYSLYLAYHDGQGGYLKKTYSSKQWLINVARRVASRSQRYDAQLKNCEAELQKKRWWFF